jgi:sporulation integral membrane protein YlbJ
MDKMYGTGDIQLVMHKLRRLLPLLIVALALISLILFSDEAIKSAVRGLALCAEVILPSLLPFFILSCLLSELGLPRLLGRLATPMMSVLFKTRGEGAAAFIIGIMGGYPLGAAAIVDMYKRNDINKNEAEHLLIFCDNTGPAFIFGVAGAGVFNNAAAGLLLYLVHIVSAAAVGIFTSSGKQKKITSYQMSSAVSKSFPVAFAASVRSAVSSTLTICGFVIFFTVVVGVLDGIGVFATTAGEISIHIGLPLHWVRSLLTGILELGSGIGSMNGLSLSPLNLALAAFILGWGGLSVHSQVLALIGDSGLSSAGHFWGKMFHGIFSAALAYLIGGIVF